jgi:type IV pilus assembly protein PilC
MVLVALLMVFFQERIADDFRKIFKDFGTRLPPMTQFLFYVAPWFEWLLAAAAGLLGAIVLASRLVPVAAWISAIVSKIPVIGPMLRWAGWTQFSRLMGLLVEQGVPLPAALRLTAAGVHDAAIAAGCRRAAAAVEDGASLHETLASLRPFPPSLVPLVEWGERSQTLADAFRAASDVFEGRARAQSILVEIVLPPLAFVAIILFIGFAVLALMMPLISLISHLSS